MHSNLRVSSPSPKHSFIILSLCLYTSILIPMLLYMDMVFPLSWKVACKQQRALFIIFWGFQKIWWKYGEKVLWNTLYKEKHKGGLGLPKVFFCVWMTCVSLCFNSTLLEDIKVESYI